MPITVSPDPDTNAFILFCLKVASYFMTFVGGIVAATWAVAAKFHGYENRLKTVENAQVKCQAGPLTRLDEKLDYIIEEG